LSFRGRHIRSFYAFGSDRLWLACVASYLLTIALEGPVRLLLHAAGATSALYLRDLVVALPIAAALFSWLAGQASAAPVAAAAGIVLMHFLIGLLTLQSPMQALLGAKMLLPALSGIAIAPIVRQNWPKLLRFALLILLATALGVGVNTVYEYPWIGLSYETAFGESTAARQWWAQGALRLPGFTRGSMIAATVALVSLVPCIVTQRLHWGLRALLFGVASVTIVLTTSKGPTMALVGLAIQLGLLCTLRSSAASTTFLAACALLCLALPSLSLLMNGSEEGVPTLLLSFMERITLIWPMSFDLLDSWYQVLVGRGLGGIGVGQLRSEWSRYSPGDNLMVYLLVTFGLLGPAYVAIMLHRLARFSQVRASTDFEQRCLHGWTVVWLVNGFSGAMIEDATSTLVMGTVLGTMFFAPRASPAISTVFPPTTAAWAANSRT
jgi:hypothetical protein